MAFDPIFSMEGANPQRAAHHWKRIVLRMTAGAHDPAQLLPPHRLEMAAAVAVGNEAVGILSQGGLGYQLHHSPMHLAGEQGKHRLYPHAPGSGDLSRLANQ